MFGESGCGKTTLLNLLAGQISADDGTFTFRGRTFARRIDAMTAERCMAYIPQDPHFADYLSLEDNLRLSSTDDGEIEQKLQKFGLVDKVGQFPAQLSGGERQRAAIVRALLEKKEVLLLDELTASLDAENLQEIARLLTKSAALDTVVVIAALINSIFGIVLALVAIIAIISVIFIHNQVRQSLFYRRRSLGYLQIFNVSKRQILTLLILEYFYKTVMSLAVSVVLFGVINGISAAGFGIRTTVSALPFFVLLVLLGLYGTFAVILPCRRFLKQGIMQLIGKEDG